MKKVHWIALILLVASVGLLLSVLNKTSTYAGFSEAEKNEGKEFHVAGVWIREKSFVYRPEIDPNRVEFFMKDVSGNEKPVVLLKPLPPDFDKSEQIVLVGSMKQGVFYASEILLKCPSKYAEQKPNSYQNSGQ